MAHVMVLFNLKPGVDQAAYEEWARTRDLPTVNGLSSVDSFRVFTASGLLGGGDSPYAYVEIIDVNSMDGLMQDIGSEAMQQIAAEFGEFSDNPLFIVTDELGS